MKIILTEEQYRLIETILQEVTKPFSSDIEVGGGMDITFVKKNGEVRKMHCRLKVTKHLRGGEKKYDSDALNYLTVYDLKKKDYRIINLNSLIELKYNGKILKRKV